MTEKADIVIIGAGIIGVSVAYQLARKKAGKVLVLDRDLIGEGSTGRCAGGVRQQFATELNIKLSAESVRVYENLKDEIGVDAEFRQYGYLFLASSPAQVNLFQSITALQRSLGVNVDLLSPQDVKDMLPHVNVEDVLGAAFCPTDGYAGPNEVVHAFARAAKREGVEIRENTEVTGVDLAGGRVTAVVTASGNRIETDRVLNAAGPWAAGVGRMVGLNLPISPVRHEAFMSRPFAAIGDRHPMVVDFKNGWWFRKEGQGILMSGDVDSEPSWKTDLRWNSLERNAMQAVHRVPCLEDAEFSSGWAGLLEMTPDHNAILGKVAQIDGFYCAVGFSAHGFMHAPAVGRIMAEILVDGRSTTDVSSMRFERFQEGELYEERMILHSAGAATG